MAEPDDDYELTEQEELVVARGEDAQSLLDNPAFLNVIETIRSQCSEAILTSPPDAAQAREDAYQLSRALSAVTAELITLSSVAQGIIENAKLRNVTLQADEPEVDGDI